MTTHQKIKGQARNSAKTAPKADPDIAEKAKKDAQASDRRKPAQPLYKTQKAEGAGENLHHDKDAIVSDFDDPAGNKVR